MWARLARVPGGLSFYYAVAFTASNTWAAALIRFATTSGFETYTA